MSEVVLHNPTPVEQQIELAKTLAPSGLLPDAFKGNPANLVYAIQYADALGLAPIHAITGIAVIKGKPTASADLMAAIVRRAGHRLRIVGDDTYAEAVLIRKDDPTFEYKTRWDAAKAKTAGLTSNPTYSKYPGQMYRARAISEVVRMGASDAMYGLIYSPEDFGEMASTPDTAPATPGPTTKVSRKKKEPEPVDAEVVPENTVADTHGQDELRAKLAETGEAPSAGAFTRMFAILGENGLTGREEALGYVSDIVGRQIETRTELTAQEVAKVSDSFNPTPEETA